MIVGVLLHCRPVKYNWATPMIAHPHCFNLRPLVITVAACGLALDALSWTLPHCVIWRLQLRLAHKTAITAIFALSLLYATSYLATWTPSLTPPGNIVIGGLRISALTDAAYSGDVTYGIGTTLIWSMAQMSSAIIVACCPLLRPLFEMVVPRKLTRLSPRRSTPQLSKQDSITVTTQIDVYSNSWSEPIVAKLHDVLHESWAPTFHVESRAREERHLGGCCGGCLS
jgi:hypothetical protein